MAEVSNPHDALFKWAFGHVEDARTLLRSQVPRDLRDRIDWDSLRVVSGSFVDPALQDRHTDLLFCAQLEGVEVLLYLLVEHQSRPDRWMPLRLVEYQLAVWRRWRRDHPRSHQLPIIIPIVVHHGERRWSAPTTLQALFEVPPDLIDGLRPHVLRQQLLLDDLASVTDEDLDRRALSAFADLSLRALARMRHMNPSEVARELERWVRLGAHLAEAPSGLPKLGALLHYVAEVSEVEEEDLLDFARALEPPMEDDTVTTLAQRWMAQGREEGREEGRAELLLRMLTMKFHDLPVEVVARVRAGSASDIDRWSDRFVRADTLDAVFSE